MQHLGQKRMRIVSVNASLPVEVEHAGKRVETGIFKEPVDGPVRVSKENLSGDRQADLVNHGGRDKAVYAYSFDNYAYWQELLGIDRLRYGQFGENLTVSGLDESVVYIGDHIRAGDLLMAVTQPRVPCYKLGIRLDNRDVPKLFSKSARTGFYMRVLEVGTVEAGDEIEIVQRGEGAIPVRKLFEAFFQPREKNTTDVLKQALSIPELSSDWRQKIERRLEHSDLGASVP
jgi:MOSC domain-containing protein YiiM